MKFKTENLRLVAPVLFFIFAALLIRIVRGHYHAVGTFIFLALLAPYIRFIWQTRETYFIPENILSRTLKIGLVIFCAALFYDPLIYDSGIAKWELTVKILLGVNFALSVGLLLGFRPRWMVPTLWLTVLATRTAALFAAPYASIDVFTSSTQAADALLQGLSPYSHTYTDIYSGRYDYLPCFAYWPGLLYAITIVRWIFGDIRFLCLFSDLGSALILKKLAGKHFSNENASLVGLLWWLMPMSIFVQHSAWIDPFLTLLTLMAISLLMNRAIYPLAACCALILSIKQYGGLLVFWIFLALLKTQGWKKTIHAGILTSALTAAIFLPILIWDGANFYHMTIQIPLTIGMRPDSFSIPALMYRLFKWKYISSMSTIPYLLALLGLSYWFWHSKYENSRSLIIRWSAGVMLLYLVIFMFGKQAFCNYYYYWLSFVLVHLLLVIRTRTTR